MPGSQRWQGEEYFYRSRNGNAALRLICIAPDYRAISGVEKREMAWGMSWRGNHFERTDAVSFMQQEGWFRFADRIATARGHLRLGGVQALIAGHETCISLADSYRNVRQSLVQRVQ